MGDSLRAVPVAQQALALARHTGAPAVIAQCLLALGTAVAETDPDQARTYLRESRELSANLGYQSAIDLSWEASIAFLVGDHVAALELTRTGISRLQPSGDRIRAGFILHMVARILATARPEAAAIIHGIAQAQAVGPAERILQVSSDLAEALGAERAQKLQAQGANMSPDQAIAYTLIQIDQALGELTKNEP